MPVRSMWSFRPRFADRCYHQRQEPRGDSLVASRRDVDAVRLELIFRPGVHAVDDDGLDAASVELGGDSRDVGTGVYVAKLIIARRLIQNNDLSPVRNRRACAREHARGVISTDAR